MMAPVGLGMRFSRLRTLRASSNGQALLTWACASNSELTSIFGTSLGFGLGAGGAAASFAWLMLASSCGSALRRGARGGVLVWGGRAMAGNTGDGGCEFRPTNFTNRYLAP